MQLVDAASLVATTSTLTIGGVVYTADAAETITTGTFQKWTTGSTLQNVEDTARAWCASSTVTPPTRRFTPTT